MIKTERLLRFCKFVDNKRPFCIKNIEILHNVNLKQRKVCLFMHGTSGFSKNCVNYMKMLHKLGFFIIAPHRVSYHSYLCNIYKQKKICGRHTKYSTTPPFAEKNKILYSYLAKFRKHEAESCFRFFKPYLNLESTIILGVSEGGIAVSLARIHQNVKKFICSYSIERNYFTQRFPVIHSYPKQHVIQIIGTHDEFFGKCNSVSATLKKNIKGHGYCTFKRQKKKNYTIYLLKNQKHSLLESKNRMLMSAIIYSHLGAKQKRISPKFATLYFNIRG